MDRQAYKYFCGVLALVITCGIASAQTSTAPADDPQAEIRKLKERVQELTTANALLKKRIEVLTKSATPAAHAPFTGDTFSRRAQEYVSKNRLEAADKTRTLSDAAKIDHQIADYVRKNNLSRDTEAALYSGQVSIGMPEDAVKIIGNLDVQTETVGSKTYRLTVWQPEPDARSIQIVITDGKVTLINHD